MEILVTKLSKGRSEKSLEQQPVKLIGRIVYLEKLLITTEEEAKYFCIPLGTEYTLCYCEPLPRYHDLLLPAGASSKRLSSSMITKPSVDNDHAVLTAPCPSSSAAEAYYRSSSSSSKRGGPATSSLSSSSPAISKYRKDNKTPDGKKNEKVGGGQKEEENVIFEEE